jgi:hypothetical protein
MTFLNKEMVDLYHLNFLNDEIWREIYILSYHGLMSGISLVLLKKLNMA